MGDDVADSATTEQPRVVTGWHARFLVAFGRMGVDANEQSKALVGAVGEAGVPMRPFDFGDDSTLQNIAGVGALLVLAGLMLGAAPDLLRSRGVPLPL